MLDVLELAARCLQGHFAACENTAYTEEVHARETEKVSELRAHEERMSQSVDNDRACVAGLVDPELARVRWVFNASLSESESSSSREVSNVHECFPFEASSDALGPYASCLSNQA